MSVLVSFASVWRSNRCYTYTSKYIQEQTAVSHTETTCDLVFVSSPGVRATLFLFALDSLSATGKRSESCVTKAYGSADR